MVKGKNLALTILMSIIITALIIGFINVGINLFLDEPQYDDYCDYRDKVPEQIPNNEIQQCYEEYELSMFNYSRTVFFILSGIALLLLMLGLFIDYLPIQIIGMASGGILAVEGIVQNRASEVEVFISIGVLIIIAIYFTIKKLKVI